MGGTCGTYGRDEKFIQCFGGKNLKGKRKLGRTMLGGIQPFFVRVPPDIISLQLCTPKVVGA